MSPARQAAGFLLVWLGVTALIGLVAVALGVPGLTYAAVWACVTAVGIGLYVLGGDGSGR